MKSENESINPRDGERGNVLFLILIAVALFAALSLAVTQSSRSGSGNGGSSEKVKLLTSAILQDFALVKSTIDRLVLMGCEKMEISTYMQKINRFTNLNAPSDNSCHLYHPAGGGLSEVFPDEEALDPAHSGSSRFGQISFEKNTAFRIINGENTIYSVEIVVPYVSDEVCLEINQRMLDIDSIPTDTNQAAMSVGYDGGVNYGGVIYCENTDLGNNRCGGDIGCFKINDMWGSGQPGNYAYQLLMRNPP